ncbi:17967_t:CDS:2 [Funneliformis geosporum]|uniref:Poly [ADP-ribose] polymerase n=1 Tax=Funneliformis geosporum TaxID=1117311 RepID=A0A9W4WUV7_9GLOM|nr:9291_t:CDS:2 [Funneliformis geosporum]CAI2188831.1 17967_t:CDS:2 [Funneliformis geosporum]
MSSIFDGCYITFSGVFTEGNHTHLTSIIIKHGGNVVQNLSKKSTHLIVNEEDYKKGNSKVFLAKNKFADQVSIVTWKWVEASIEKNVKLDVSDYVPSDDTEDTDMDDANENSIVTGKRNKDDEENDQVDDVRPSRKRRRTAKNDNDNDMSQISTTDVATTNIVSTTSTSSKKRKGKKTDKTTKGSINNQDPNDSDQDDKVAKVAVTHIVEEKKMVKVVIKGYGSKGQSTTFGPTTILDNAKIEFSKKFKEKTGNDWSIVCKDISKFVPKNNKYTFLNRDYTLDDEDKNDESQNKKKAKNKEKEEPIPIPESNLHPKVQDIMQMIFDVNQWKESMKELEYDAAKLPLGKIAKSTINQGYSVLKRIEAVVMGNSIESLEELSNEFYTVIPHSFGMRKPPIINNINLLKAKMDMVEILGEIEIASTLIKGCDEAINPLDAHYKSLRLGRMEPLDHNSLEFKMVVDYVKNTHGATHNHFKLEVMEVFDLERQGERERFEPYSKLQNRALLWHGSRKTNFAGILSQGLRIAPPSAPVSGYMFGKGVYFADSVSKSAQYVNNTSRDNIGLMLLNEVALGNMLELDSADFDAGIKAKKANFHSVKGCGKNVPDMKCFIKLNNGCIVPNGKLQEQHSDKYLYYNEYIVYDEAQIMQKYLIKMKFH